METGQELPAPASTATEEPVGTPEPVAQTPEPASVPTPPPAPVVPQSVGGLVEIVLDEVEAIVFDAAHDARRAKIAPVEKQYLDVKAQADARYDESVLKVLRRHGLTKVPEKYGVDLRDKDGKLITPCKFRYIPDQGSPAPQIAPKVKPFEKLTGQKHGPQKKR